MADQKRSIESCGQIYYWSVFVGLLSFSLMQMTTYFIEPSNDLYWSSAPSIWLIVPIIFLLSSIAVLLVFLEHKDRYGWFLAIVGFVAVGLFVGGSLCYLIYWLSRINGLER